MHHEQRHAMTLPLAGVALLCATQHTAARAFGADAKDVRSGSRV